MKKQIWKDVKNYQGIYQVSSWGRVRSVNRTISVIKNNVVIKKYYKGKNLKPQKDAKGYVHFRLAKGGVYQLFKGHQLVAQQFLRYNRKDRQGMVVDHINNKKADNRLVNLQVISHGQNIKKGWKISPKLIANRQVKNEKNN